MKQENEVTRYMDEHGWKRRSDGGTVGIYTNGKLFVFCNGMEYIISKTPDASGRYAKGFKSMLPAFKYADARA